MNEEPERESRSPRLSPVVRYTASRVALFAASLGVLWLVRVHGYLLVALALLVSGLLSFVLLRGQREELSAHVGRRIERAKANAAARAAREDAIADEIIAEQDEDARQGARGGLERAPESAQPHPDAHRAG